MAMVRGQEEKIPLPKLLDAVLPYHASVYVTVLNIIQCIILAFLVTEIRELDRVQALDFHCIMRAIVALVMVLVVWHRYVSESRYLWLISWWDTIIPFSMGAVECLIVFSINAEDVPLRIFVAGIILFECVTLSAYGNAYHRRKTGFTKRLYQDFYAGYPQFTAHLLEFLKDFDTENLKDVSVATIFSIVIFFMVSLWPDNSYEVIFPGLCIAIFVAREMIHSLQTLLKLDKFLGTYFNERG